ncbi:MAG: rhodanese-like domain-containing protein, partial [Saprospiraceae bacterium]
MNDITVEELKEKMDNNENFIFIDVREPYEYEEFNLGAKLIPMGSLPSALPDLLQHKDEEIIIHCRSGARSGSAKITLMNLGFT